MNDFEMPILSEARPQRALLPAPDHETGRPAPSPREPRSSGRWLVGLGALLLLIGALALGVWQHFDQHREVMTTAVRQAAFVPSVRVGQVAQRHDSLQVTLPGTTLAFEQADIYGRASGYVLKRNVDIGDRVKTGQLLAEISAPEVDYQIAQLQNSLQQAQSTTRQTEANRSLAQVT